MLIQIVGTGCPKCNLLEQNTKTALEALALEAMIEKVSDADEIMELGVMLTPALVIDGTIVSSGQLLSSEQIKNILSP